MFEIFVVTSAMEELRGIAAHYRRRIMEAIETQLTHEPNVATRNRKLLIGIAPGFDHVPPVWELRVDKWRVFYDVDEEFGAVNIRAVREKSGGRSTGEIAK